MVFYRGRAGTGRGPLRLWFSNCLPAFRGLFPELLPDWGVSVNAAESKTWGISWACMRSPIQFTGHISQASIWPHSHSKTRKNQISHHHPNWAKNACCCGTNPVNYYSFTLQEVSSGRRAAPCESLSIDVLVEIFLMSFQGTWEFLRIQSGNHSNISSIITCYLCCAWKGESNFFQFILPFQMPALPLKSCSCGGGVCLWIHEYNGGHKRRQWDGVCFHCMWFCWYYSGYKPQNQKQGSYLATPMVRWIIQCSNIVVR